MSDDRMAMYEAQAIAVEKQLEIDRLKREREEMAECMRRLALQIGRTEESQGRNNDDVLVAMNRLTGQVETIQARIEEIDTRFDELQQNSTRLWEVLHDLRQENAATKNLLQKITPMTMLVLGGCDGNSVLDDILLLKKNNWSKLSLKLPKPTSDHGTVHLNGEIYIFGGNLGNQTYKLDKDLKWTHMADMNQERWYITNGCLEWNVCIWVFGGSSDRKGEKSLKSVERYDPKEDKWTEMPSMKHARMGGAAAVWNGKFIICGGFCDGNALKSVECFDPESGIWTILDDLPVPLSGHVVIPYRNNLVLIGGWNGKTQINSVLELSTVEGKLVEWKKLSSMKNAHFSFSAVVLNDEIYVIGGHNGENLMVETEIFDGTKWRDGPDLPHKNIYMSAITILQNVADSLFNYKP